MEGGRKGARGPDARRWDKRLCAVWNRERPHHTDRTVRREGVNEKRENVQICTVECLMCESLTNKRRELLVVRRARPGGRTQAVGGRMHIARGTAAHLAEEARLAYAR